MTTKPPSMEPARTVDRLVAIMAALRTPVTGCPWDLEQTFTSIAPYTIEEAYEVADAIERDDPVDLREELGDLLLQVVYHAQLATEAGTFDFGDVVYGITRKMIRRHPHVFGDEKAPSADDAKASWARIKAEEKAEQAAERARQGLEARKASTSILANVPTPLPALTRAVKLQDKAAAVGFDWPSLIPVLAKMREELAELEAEITPSETPADIDKARVEEEFGDLLFVMANVARHLDIDPETALRNANTKFTRRFEGIEERLAASGKTPAESSLEEMDALWDAIKAAERS